MFKLLNDKIVITFNAQTGQHIRPACSEALAFCASKRVYLAQRYVGTETGKLPVVGQFEFNGVTVELTENDTEESLFNQFEEKLEKQHQAYLNSPECREKEARNKSEVAEIQDKLNLHVTTLPRALISGTTATVAWILKFCQLADRVGITYDTLDIKAQFVSKGYRDNAYVGEKEKIEVDLEANGHWVIGQVMTFIGAGMGFPGMCQIACERYLDRVSAAQ